MRSESKMPFTITTNVDQLLESWSSTDNVFIGPGCYQLEIDKYIQNERDIRSLLLLIDILEDKIKEFGEKVPAEFVNKIANFGTDIFFDQHKSQMLEALHKFKILLTGSNSEFLIEWDNE
ncbi:hypothetical protein [Gimesia panareensis]|uniref:hypothetical protein n=1 Tax=Gimesia panareensis TaxID=2527978 RepID=UPI00119E2759|nr:hypothetical protein [Gimesia panareensis]